MKNIQSFIAVKIFILSVIFFIPTILSSQTYHFDNYSVKEGLAQSSVYAITQDIKGNVWLATASGVSLFNGKEFINYTTEDGLADGAVKAIYIDSFHAVWLGHVNGGVSRYKNGQIQTILNVNADITSFTEDNEGNLWLASHGEGVFKISNPYEIKKEAINFKQYKGKEGLSDLIFQVIKLNNGSIYFVTDVGIKNYNYQKNDFQFYKIPNMPTYFQIIYMYEDKNQDLWFGSHNGGLYHYKKSLGELKIYDVRDGLASNWISSISEGENGTMWIGTWGGGVTRISSEELFIIDKTKGLKDNYIRCITTDREGNVLFGTKENGLLLYKGDQLTSYNVDNGLITDQVWAIYTDSENQNWFGTDEGISIFKNSKHIKNYTEKNGNLQRNVRFIREDKNGKVWVGTFGSGVLTFNLENEQFDMNYIINSNMLQPLVTALEIDKTNLLWVGTTDGLVYYEIDNQKVDRLTQYHGLAGNDISAIYADSKNTVWIGSRRKGLTKIIGDKISKIELDEKITPTTIIEDKKGILWVGTEGKGVLLFNGNKIIKKYTVNQGLLSDYITLLNIDDKGNIWIGSNKGLNKFDIEKNRFYVFDDKMGYVGLESKNSATYKDKEGNLWFGTIKGTVKLDTDKEIQNTLEPLTQITGFLVNLEERKMLDGLELNHREKSVVFNYSSICLTNPNQVFYKVMLEGLEKDWRPITQETHVTYSPLPPGEYTFKVIACNNTGVWNSKAATYNFEIIPPLWQRAWFIILCVLALVVSIVIFIKIREKNLIKEKQILEKKVIERTEEVVQKSEELELKNKDIIDSITYAKRIQDAILPAGEMFTKQLKQTFVLFKPKDIVSGDFYWLAEKGSKSLFAAVDCTGHGVPGAFMSIVGYNLLDKIVGEYDITTPGEILNELNKGVSLTLRQEADSDTINDGMDIALCCFDKQTNILEFAGAYNPLYVVSKNKLMPINGIDIAPVMTDQKGLMLYEIKSDRFPIGSYTDNLKTFTTHQLQLTKGDTIYLFSDGFADQFGGIKGKKYRYKKFKQILLSINSENMDKQGDILTQEFNDWKGVLEQIDDVIVIGSRL